MSRELLEQFFEKNKVDTEIPSAPAMIHFFIKLSSHPDAFAEMEELIKDETQKLSDDLKEKKLAQKNEIEAAASPEQVIQIMRKQLDPSNQRRIINKAMEFENEVIPEIIKMLKTSLNDSFIEIAAQILAKCGKETAQELFEDFDSIRNPYAQSAALVALGFKADETQIPWFIEKYDELSRSYPDEKFCDGAYFALFEIANRFYAQTPPESPQQCAPKQCSQCASRCGSPSSLS